eukprot:30865-Pelagococcus_subviridis.AAC.1
MWHSSGTGRTDGRKLKRPSSSIPSQSPKSRAFASAVDRPTILTGCFVRAEMYRMRETITSRIGPRSAPRR